MTSNEIFIDRYFETATGAASIKFYRPVKNEKSGIYHIDVEIIINKNMISRQFSGNDSLDSLIMAMTAVGLSLYSGNLDDTSTWNWMDHEHPGYLGLPLLDSDRDFLRYDPIMSLVI